MTKDKQIIILGAGLTGLSSAFHLKNGYAIFEKEDEVGGMARSLRVDGYLFDYDGHLLHFKDEYVFSLVRDLMMGNMAPHKRNSWIYSKGRYSKYPFQANFYGLPKNVIKDCLVGLIKVKARISLGEERHNGNFENWIKKTFGDGIAEHFMLPYNRKFWTVEPKELTCDWMKGFVPVPSLEDTVTGAISSNTKSYGYNAKFWYPIKGGISELANGFLKNINNVNLSKKAVTLDQYRKEIVFDDGTIKKFSHLITTIPMPELFRIMVRMPEEVKAAFSKLKYTSIFVVNLGIKRDDITDRHWIYYPEENTVFYRAGFPTNFSMDIAPSGRTSLYAEISYSPDKGLDKAKARSDTLGNLRELGIIADEKEVETCVPMDIKYGYVIYDNNRKAAVQTIKNYLKRFDIHSVGRYGGWEYMSMEDVILEGRRTAQCLLTS